MRITTQILALTVGGACGVNARYWLSLVLARWLGTRFPWSTFLINVSGSFAIGLLAMILAERFPHPLIRIFVLTGFLGGYTTFSAYMFETFTLWDGDHRILAVSNLVGSIVAGLLAVILGVAVGRSICAPTALEEPEVERRFEAIGEAMAGGDFADEPIA